MPEVLWDEAAIRDLDQIWDHIGRENQNPTAAPNRRSTAVGAIARRQHVSQH